MVALQKRHLLPRGGVQDEAHGVVADHNHGLCVVGVGGHPIGCPGYLELAAYRRKACVARSCRPSLGNLRSVGGILRVASNGMAVIKGDDSVSRGCRALWQAEGSMGWQNWYPPTSWTLRPVCVVCQVRFFRGLNCLALAERWGCSARRSAALRRHKFCCAQQLATSSLPRKRTTQDCLEGSTCSCSVEILPQHSYVWRSGTSQNFCQYCRLFLCCCVFGSHTPK